MPTRSDSAKIRRLREDLGLNCSQLAKAAGIDLALLWKVENNKLDGSPKTRLAIAQALGVAVADITYFEPTRSSAKQAA